MPDRRKRQKTKRHQMETISQTRCTLPAVAGSRGTSSNGARCHTKVLPQRQCKPITTRARRARPGHAHSRTGSSPRHRPPRCRCTHVGAARQARGPASSSWRPARSSRRPPPRPRPRTRRRWRWCCPPWRSRPPRRRWRRRRRCWRWPARGCRSRRPRAPCPSRRSCRSSPWPPRGGSSGSSAGPPTAGARSRRFPRFPFDPGNNFDLPFCNFLPTPRRHHPETQGLNPQC